MPARYAVIGGAGAMGRITVRDLYETCASDDEVIVGDYDLEKAQALVRDCEALGRKGAPKLRAAQVNVREAATAVRALGGAQVLINAAPYHLNLEVMELALLGQAHYVDLGGLFHVTRKQLALDGRFKAIGRTALLGMGAAPGITNILSRYAADQLDSVQEIHCRVASVDRTRYVPKPALAVSYSLQTILEEFSFNPAVYRKGETVFVEPMSGDVPHRFPPPIGVQRPMYTIHSEVATLPQSFQAKGVKEVSFKIAFDPEFTDRVRFLRDLGMASHEPIAVEGVQVRPISVVNKIAMSQPAVKRVGKLRQYEVVRSVVKGKTGGKKLTYVVDCHTTGMPAWDLGLDIDTGCPPSIAAQMILHGEITERGALAPEAAVPPEAFFRELKKRKMTVKTTRLSGWGMKT